jgi:hypothetical protein
MRSSLHQPYEPHSSAAGTMLATSDDTLNELFAVNIPVDRIKQIDQDFCIFSRIPSLSIRTKRNNLGTSRNGTCRLLQTLILGIDGSNDHVADNLVVDESVFVRGVELPNSSGTGSAQRIVSPRDTSEN